jgi:hypothetical protein
MNMLRFIVKKWLTELLITLFLFVTAPLVLCLGWLVHSQQSLFLGIPLALGWFLGSWWFGLTTARHMFEDNLLFLSAIRRTLSDLRLLLTCVPLIGWCFAADEDKTRNDDDA